MSRNDFPYSVVRLETDHSAVPICQHVSRRAQRWSRRAAGPRTAVRLVLDGSEHADTLSHIRGCQNQHPALDRQHGIYRDELYDLQWDKPRPLVPRYLRLTIRERVDHSGGVLKTVDASETHAVVQRLLDLGVDAIAVCLFNAYSNSVNEQAVAGIIREMAPNIALSLSSEVDPRIREYERVSTTTLNAYAMPRMHSYMSRLETALQQKAGIRYMHSGGGVIPSTTAERFPIQLLVSGPAAGVLAGRFLAATLDVPNVCTIDMGGTSLDVCLIRDGEPDTRDTIEVEWGIPARTQSIDIHSVGAGGGSIVWFDAGGALRIGPASAGSDPGPACYGRGGVKPTVTDANLLLGIPTRKVC